jgi:hypothetical protein
LQRLFRRDRTAHAPYHASSFVIALDGTPLGLASDNRLEFNVVVPGWLSGPDSVLTVQNATDGGPDYQNIALIHSNGALWASAGTPPTSLQLSDFDNPIGAR